MKNTKKIFSISATLFLVFTLVTMGLLSSGIAFPGFHGNGSDQMCHANPGKAYVNDSIALTLDGIADEDLWDYGTNLKSRMTVPVASIPYGSVHEFITIIFAQNSTHLFTYIEWSDPTIEASTLNSDGFSFCWNINVETFDATYFSGMTQPEEGEMVDSYTWKADASEDGSQLPASDTAETQAITGSVVDKMYDDGGWSTDDTNEIEVAAIHGNISSHGQTNWGIEVVRPLASGDTQDLQMLESKVYEFTFAIYNGSSGIDHWVSVVNAVYIVGTEGIEDPAPDPDPAPIIPGFQALYIIVPIAIVAMAVLLKRKVKI